MTLVGISIPVPEPWGSQLRARRLSYGDSGAETIPTHVTLVPPLVVDAGELVRLREALRKVALGREPFELELAGTGTFRPVSQVVYLALAEGVARTAELAADVRVAVEAPEASFDFHPHVTVAQDVAPEELDRAAAELAVWSCRFTVDGFALYDHREPEGWTLRENFPFG